MIRPITTTLAGFVMSLSGFAQGSPVAADWQHLLQKAESLRDSNQPAQADEAYQAALDYARTLDPHGIEAGVTAANLGELYHESGQFAAAERCYLEAASDLQRNLAPADSNRMRVSANLAALYLETGRVTKAESVLNRALSVRSAAPLDSVGGLLVIGLGYVRMRQQRFQEAEILFRQVVDGFASQSRPEATQTWANAMLSLADVLGKTGHPAAAYDCARRALAAIEAMPGANPQALIKTLTISGWLSGGVGTTQEGDVYFQRAIRLCQLRYPADHPLLGGVLDQYASFLFATNRKRESKRIGKLARAIQEKSLRDNLLGHTVELSDLLAAAR